MRHKLVNNLRNRIGWSTNRHIVVFESDDWGSVRTRSLEDRNYLQSRGIDMMNSIFSRYDCLESDLDLDRLFNLLLEHKDSSGRPPVFTPMCVMANPDFVKIQNGGYLSYYYEPFYETHKQYNNHDKVLDYWKKGRDLRLFVPALHAREHLNVKRWMEGVQDCNNAIRIAFEHGTTGASMYIDGRAVEPNAFGAFYSQDESDFMDLYTIAKDACSLFTDILGSRPTHFIGPDAQPIKKINKALVESGVKYITNFKNCFYPIGNGRFQRELNWPGKYNKEFGYTNICRNGGFEQVNPARDYVNECLYDIEQAFKYHKPSVISTHRVNYIGSIEESNATNGLQKLATLLKEIEKRWPDVEYMTSTELGDLMTS